MKTFLFDNLILISLSWFNLFEVWSLMHFTYDGIENRFWPMITEFSDFEFDIEIFCASVNMSDTRV